VLIIGEPLLLVIAALALLVIATLALALLVVTVAATGVLLGVRDGLVYLAGVLVPGPLVDLVADRLKTFIDLLVVLTSELFCVI
jgi:hypothetical protein